jgi:hypothetical protein
MIVWLKLVNCVSKQLKPYKKRHYIDWTSLLFRYLPVSNRIDYHTVQAPNWPQQDTLSSQLTVLTEMCWQCNFWCDPSANSQCNPRHCSSNTAKLLIYPIHPLGWDGVFQAMCVIGHNLAVKRSNKHYHIRYDSARQQRLAFLPLTETHN